MDNNKIGFEVKIRGETHIFQAEQIMAYYLKKVKTYFEKAGMPSKEIVISVPSYATNSERQAYLDAAEIAGIQCVRLINESTACALTYGFFRKNDLDEKKPRTVDEMKDAAFNAEAKKLGLPVSPIIGADAETTLKEIYDMPAAVVAKAKAMIKR